MPCITSEIDVLLTLAQNIQMDTGKLATNVAKERELSTKLVGELAKNIAMYKNTPMSITARDDPSVFLFCHLMRVIEACITDTFQILQLLVSFRSRFMKRTPFRNLLL